MGFQFTETLSGNYTTFDYKKENKKIYFSITSYYDNQWPSIKDDFTSNIKGTVCMDDVVNDAELEGFVEISFIRRRQINYKFTFNGTDGKKYRFVGSKDLDFWRPILTTTTLNGKIFLVDTNEQFASVTAVFDIKHDLVPFLFSFKKN